MNVQIEVTTRCNYNCHYCAGREMKQQDMSFMTFLKIIEGHIEKYGVPEYVSLQGEGEPTLNRSFFDMASYVRSIGSIPTTITNGTYNQPERFLESFDTVGISIDTIDVDKADSIGRYNLPKVLQFVENIRRKRIGKNLKVIIYTVGGVQDKEELIELSNWCIDNGLMHIVQPLQTKDDYSKKYENVIHFHKPIKNYQCDYLSRDRLRYYDLDGKEMPCCFIKDTSTFISIEEMKSQLKNKEIPTTCTNCRMLT